MIAAVTTTYNEADIIGLVVDHLYRQGVDRIYAADASDDPTSGILADRGVIVVEDPEPYHYQPRWIEHLSRMAGADGADWVIPFDADEFWCGTHGRTIRDALATVPTNATKILATMWAHHDVENREVAPKPLPKVAFRAAGLVRVHEGNHDADLPGRVARDVLEVREIQYRGFDHFCRKAAERNRTIDPALGDQYGAHHKRLAGLDVEALRDVYDRMMSVGCVRDPIPGCRPDDLRIT